MGVTVGFGYRELKNELRYDVSVPSSTVSYYYKNTLPMSILKFGIAGKIDVDASKLELFSSLWANVVFAEFFQHSEISGEYSNLEGHDETFGGPYIRFGAAYKILSWLSIYSDFEYTVIPADYHMNLLNTDYTVYVHNSDLGGSALRLGLPLNF